ncbi:MAG: hypothetical protein R2857_07555 [Vampirovibrionales bacterium]
MVTAVLISIVVMMVALEHISTLIDRHPSIKILALSFLMLIGAMPRRRRLPRPCAPALHLFCPGIFCRRGMAQHQNPKRPADQSITGTDT